MPETRSAWVERIRLWAIAHPSELAAIAFCATAIPLAAVDAVSQSVLNAAILTVLAILAVEMLRHRVHEKQQIAESVVKELARSSGSVQVFDDPERVYAEAMHLIRNAGAQEAGDRVIRIASVRATPPGDYEALPRTRGLMAEVYDKLAEGWTVRRVLNIPTAERLDWELANQPPGKPRYELRVHVGNPLPLLTPLVIGRRHALLARHDPQGIGVSHAAVLSGDSAVGLVSDYFDSLWAAPDLIELRSQQGIDASAVPRIRRLLESHSGAQTHSSIASPAIGS